MEKYNQLKEELKQLEQDFRIQRATYNQRIAELKHQIEEASNKYIVCGNCNAKVKIRNIDLHLNSMKHIIATLPKKSES